MKKRSLRIWLFTAVFCLVYLMLCYFIPGWRLKLAADPLTYFLATLRSMALIKAGISALTAGILTAVITRK